MEWTFFVFLNGNNNLDPFGDINIKQMEEIGSTDQVNILVQWASLSRPTVQRLLIKKNGDGSNEIVSPVVQDIGPVDMGDYRTLVDFLKWGAYNYPAKKYFVSVWNHGSGWHSSFARQQKAIQRFTPGNGFLDTFDISFDDNTENKITTPQLGEALKQFSEYIEHKVELYACDACLMSIAEVASEMQESVEYFAGSQDLEPGYGWPYHKFLSRWVAKPTMSGRELAGILSEEYFSAYSGGVYGNSSVTFSALDLAHFSSFEEAMKNFGTEFYYLGRSKLLSVMNSANESLLFTMDDYRDLKDFLLKIKPEQGSRLADRLTRLQLSLDRLVITNHASAPAFSNAHGLSIWMPITQDIFDKHKVEYKDLKFNKNTNWLSALSRWPRFPNKK